MHIQFLFNKYKQNRTFKNLFADSTIIQNYNGLLKNILFIIIKLFLKKQMKISVICDNNKIVI